MYLYPTELEVKEHIYVMRRFKDQYEVPYTLEVEEEKDKVRITFDQGDGEGYVITYEVDNEGNEKITIYIEALEMYFKPASNEEINHFLNMVQELLTVG